MLDPLLRRVSDEDWSRREPALHLTLRGAHEVLVHLHFLASKNMTEYEALLCGLRITIEIGIKRLNIRGDSKLIINQVMKNASCYDEKMEAYCNAVRALEDKFYGIELNHILDR
jgi:ribonuclease HI